MSHRSHIVLLVGPKGAGKSTLGALLERDLGARFIRVESIYLQVLQAHPNVDPASLEPLGFEAILKELDCVAQSNRVVCIESTGTAGYFPTFLARLQAQHRVTLVRVVALAEICIARVKRRDAIGHIAVSDERVREINRVAASVRMPWDIEVNNSGEQSAEDVAQEIARALGRA